MGNEVVRDLELRSYIEQETRGYPENIARQKIESIFGGLGEEEISTDVLRSFFNNFHAHLPGGYKRGLPIVSLRKKPERERVGGRWFYSERRLGKTKEEFFIEVDEVIEYRDSIAQDKLRYFTSTPGAVFRGNTWADLFEVLGKSETCLNIKISKDRRTVSVGFHSNLQERKSASQHYYTC